MVQFAGVWIAVDAAGVTTAEVTVDDSDAFLSTEDTGTVWRVDGVALAVPPAVEAGFLSVTLRDGSFQSLSVARIEAGGRTLFLPGTTVAPEAVVDTGSFTGTGPVGAFAYLNRNMAPVDGRMYAGTTIAQTLSTLTGAVQSTDADRIVIFDDDRRLQTDAPGAPATEAGDPAIGLLGLNQQSFSGIVTATGTLAANAFALVEVDADTAGGTVTFEALRIEVNLGGRTIHYAPRAGSVDPAAVTAITAVRVIADTAPDAGYADFGFGFARNRIDGAAAAETVDGTILHDLLRGLGGADTLYGGFGEDRVLGGGGRDLIFGGHHDDAGAGGAGRDRLSGAFGRDTLDGGAGSDILRGGAGNDRLIDGAGQDTLFGGADADTFVLRADGARDTVRDWQDGIDRLDLGQPFGTLTVTTVTPGQVRIVHGGDVLILIDAAGTLAAAQITAADFV